MHPELLVKEPFGIPNDFNCVGNSGNIYRKIELELHEDLNFKAQRLDVDQSLVLDIAVDYSKACVEAIKANIARPQAPLVIVHGGAGTGKSTVIDVLSQNIERIFRKTGDDPNHPYIIRAAFTGNAALIIKGQTLHSAFNFHYGNEVLSLSDKKRDQRRKMLQNLRAVVIDEISLVKSDMLYQLHFRLSKDIFQNDLPFGGVAVFVLGDLLQIRPTLGSFVFDAPRDKRLQLFYAVEDLWKKFDVVNLKTNHRQGDDKQYADLLNRVRIGEETKTDIENLKTRVFPKDDQRIPKEALYISGTNKEVNRMNALRLNKVNGEMETFIAIVYSETRGHFEPKLDNKGDIRGTTLSPKLYLKKGCRVMLTINLDVCDGLTNGSQGEVIDFVRDKHREIKYVLVKFDEIESGKQRRMNFSYETTYPGLRATPIELKETNFSLSKKQTSASSTATAIQFPLKLAYAATAHKIQGHTVKKPNSLVIELVTWIQPAMAYVMLSRIQNLSQLFIVGSIPETKITPWMQALEELERMNAIALNKDDRKDENQIKITSLNVCSIRKHINDIKHDYELKTSNVICLQESWLHDNEQHMDEYQLPNYFSHFITSGRGKGIVTYFSTDFHIKDEIINPLYQIAKLTSENLDIINVYRTISAGNTFTADLQDLIDDPVNKTTILCGDLNFCIKKHPAHPIKLFLEEHHFVQLVENPTHIDGGVLDHVYVKCTGANTLSDVQTKMKGCYYSDHDKNVILVKI